MITSYPFKKNSPSLFKYFDNCSIEAAHSGSHYDNNLIVVFITFINS